MDRQCKTCHFASWPTTRTGRRMFASGTCTVVALIPRAYADLRGDMPQRRDISKYTKAPCMCWKKDTRKKTDSPPGRQLIR